MQSLVEIGGRCKSLQTIVGQVIVIDLMGPVLVNMTARGSGTAELLFWNGSYSGVPYIAV